MDSSKVASLPSCEAVSIKTRGKASTSRSADVDKAYAAAGRTSHEVAQDVSRLDDGKDLKFGVHY